MGTDSAGDLLGRLGTPWDLRDVPLDRLASTAEGKQIEQGVMASVEGPALLVVASFQSAV